MVVRPVPGRPGRKEYKTYLALFPWQWERLAFEASKRAITGRELIEAYLGIAANKLPDPPQLPAPDAKEKPYFDPDELIDIRDEEG